MREFTRTHFAPALFTLHIMLVLFFSCKTQGEPLIAAPPIPQLTFKNVHAESPSKLTLEFLLEVNSSEIKPDEVKLESWQVILDEKDMSSAFSLELKEDQVFLAMDLAALAADGITYMDDYSVKLIMSLDYGAVFPERVEVTAIADFPVVLAPEFQIINIAILQAELVNTRFRVFIRITNPNPYPVELSALTYELYGNNMFWAEGEQRNIILIPGKSAVEGHLFLMMNFIDMDRNLLDQIIHLIDVNYRFTGEAQVSTGVDYLPKFSTSFDLSGYSQVLMD